MGEQENNDRKQSSAGTVARSPAALLSPRPFSLSSHTTRNTDPTKWFGTKPVEDDGRTRMKVTGKVDVDAERSLVITVSSSDDEEERMKVIKSMTRVKNKSYVPKWKPPVEKDHTEDLDRQAKESLRKYEERKRLRRESGSDASHFLRSTSSSSIDFSSNNQEPD